MKAAMHEWNLCVMLYNVCSWVEKDDQGLIWKSLFAAYLY